MPQMLPVGSTGSSSSSNSSFPLPLEVEVSDDGHTARLLSPVIYIDHALGVVIEVPDGFETDFNSVPRFFWRLLGPWEYPEAGVVHDYLYRNAIGRRKDADLIHRNALLCLGCPVWKAFTAYTALRAFGWLAGNWNAH